MKKFFLAVTFYITCSILFAVNALLVTSALWMPLVFNNFVIGLIFGLFITITTVVITAIVEAKKEQDYGPAFIYLTYLIFTKLIKEA
jgi:pilus assembly protein TadC